GLPRSARRRLIDCSSGAWWLVCDSSGRRGWGGTASLLDRDHQASHRTDSNPSRQPFEFPAEHKLPHQLFLRSLCRVNPAFSIRLVAWFSEPQIAPATAWFLGSVLVWIGRHDSGSEVGVRPRFRGSDL